MLLHQSKENKLSTPYETQPYRVNEKKGNSLILDGTEGGTFMRHSTQVKKLVQMDEGVGTTKEVEAQDKPQSPIVEVQNPVRTRPQRERKESVLLKDFVQ